MNTRQQKKYRKSFKRWYKKNAVSVRARTAKWYRDNPDRVLQHRLNRYGLTVEQWEQMTISQDNKCVICGASFEKVRKVVDHNHISNKVRQLLCAHCNTAIGMLKDNLMVAKNLVAYLEKWQEVEN